MGVATHGCTSPAKGSSHSHAAPQVSFISWSVIGAVVAAFGVLASRMHRLANRLQVLWVKRRGRGQGQQPARGASGAEVVPICALTDQGRLQLSYDCRMVVCPELDAWPNVCETGLINS